MAACAGIDFIAGNKIAAKFSLGSAALSLKKSIVIDATDYGQVPVKVSLSVQES